MQWALAWLRLWSAPCWDVLVHRCGRALVVATDKAHGWCGVVWSYRLSPALKDASIVMIGDQGRFVTQEYRSSRHRRDGSREDGAACQ